MARRGVAFLLGFITHLFALEWTGPLVEGININHVHAFFFKSTHFFFLKLQINNTIREILQVYCKCLLVLKY